MASTLRTGRFSDVDGHNRNVTPVYGYLSSPLLPLEMALERLKELIVSLDRYIVISKRQCHYPSEHGLTRDESAAVYLYSMDWGEQSLYQVLNQALRDENRQTIIPWFAYLKLLDAALEKLPTFIGNVWRGVRGDISTNFANQQVLTWWSVTSCSTSVDIIKNFLTANSTLFLIEAFSAKRISMYSAYPNENEVILSPGTRLNIASGALDHVGGLHVVHLRELADDRSLLNSEPTHLHSQSLSATSMHSSVSTNNSFLSVPITSNTPPSEIQRTAIDPNGNVGIFYKACRDCFVQCSNSSLGAPVRSIQSTKCLVMKGAAVGSQNLLQMIGIETELRLSMVLGLVPTAGVGEVADYPFLIDRNTRFLCYKYLDREESLLGCVEKFQGSIRPPKPEDFVTHVTAAVQWGIDAVIVFQLAPTDTAAIDDVIDRVCQVLQSNTRSLTVPSSDQRLLERISNTKVYSNIPKLTRMTTVLDVCRDICQMKENYSAHQRLGYRLCPITRLYPNYINNIMYTPLDPLNNEHIEQYLLRLLTRMQELRKSLNDELIALLCHHFDQQIALAHEQLLNLERQYQIELENVCELVINIRCGLIPQDNINVMLTNDQQRRLNEGITDLSDYVRSLKTKELLISDLQSQGINYWNVAERGVEHGHDQATMEQILLANDRKKRILCFTDMLHLSNESQWYDLISQMISEREKNPQLDLIYADFSYCSFELNEMKILSKPNDEIINIILIGETDVGKSSFINAFANYLAFETLEQARLGQPVVIIPTSFSITINDEFEDRIIKLGDANPNEDHDHPGQSITQHYKSYIFEINDYTKVRIIDTPGIRNICNNSQDELNFKQILSAINHLSHLNAVCIFLKANVIQRESLKQMLDFIGQNAYENIIFCITHARTNYFKPGAMASPLKSILSSLSIDYIAFEKTNTFCFDNESFRYLVTIHNSIPVDDNQQRECEYCWSKSKSEMIRFLQYIRTQLTPYGKWQSIRHAEIEINSLIRPMMETIRNGLRNLVIENMGSANQFIELRSAPVSQPAVSCLSCKNEPKRLGDWWIFSDCLHEFKDSCNTCACSSSKHISVDYKLEYELSNSSTIHLTNDIQNELCDASIKFADFLMHGPYSSDDDLFMSGFNCMIVEEDDIVEYGDSSELNSSLRDELIKFRYRYERRRRQQQINQNSIDLAIIYQYIERIKTIPMIEKQMMAVKETHELFMEQNEYNIQKYPLNSFSTSL